MKTKKLLSLLLVSAMIVASSGIVSVSAADTAINYTENFTQYNATNSAFGEANKVTAAAETTAATATAGSKAGEETNGHAGATVFAENATGRWELSGMYTGMMGLLDNKATAYVDSNSFVITGTKPSTTNPDISANFKLKDKTILELNEASITLSGSSANGIRVLISEDEKSYIWLFRVAASYKIAVVIDSKEEAYINTSITSTDMSDACTYTISDIDYAGKDFKYEIKNSTGTVLVSGTLSQFLSSNGNITSATVQGNPINEAQHKNLFNALVSRAYYPMATYQREGAVTVTGASFVAKTEDAKKYCYDADFEDVNLTGKTAETSGSGVINSVTYLSSGYYYDYWRESSKDTLLNRGFIAAETGKDVNLFSIGRGSYNLSGVQSNGVAAYVKSMNGLYISSLTTSTNTANTAVNLDLGLESGEKYTSINEIDVRMLRQARSGNNNVGLRFFINEAETDYYQFLLMANGRLTFSKKKNDTEVSGSNKTTGDAVINDKDYGMCHFNVTVSGNTITVKIIRSNQVIYSISYNDPDVSAMIENSAYPFQFIIGGDSGAVIDEVKVNYTTNNSYAVDTTGDNVSVTVDADRFPSSFDFIAAYYKDGALDNLVIKNSSEISKSTPILLTKPSNGQTLRLMAWDSMNTLNPITAAVDVN